MSGGLRSLQYLAIVLVVSASFTPCASASPAKTAAGSPSDPRLQNAYRFQQGGWTYVHLEGSPAAGSKKLASQRRSERTKDLPHSHS